VEIEDAARETRIPRRFLEALETNAPIDTYPAPVYGRAFLREYAVFLGVDPEPLVATFRSAEPVEEVPLSLVREAVPAPRRWPQRVLLALSIALLAGLAVFGLLKGRTSLTHVPSQAAPPARPAAAASPGPTAAPTTPPPATARVTGIAAALHLTGPCWVQVRADGVTSFTATMQPGQAKTFRAKRELLLTLGNAGGATLAVDGRRIVTGATGQVVRLTFTVDQGKLHLTRA